MDLDLLEEVEEVDVDLLEVLEEVDVDLLVVLEEVEVDLEDPEELVELVEVWGEWGCRPEGGAWARRPQQEPWDPEVELDRLRTFHVTSAVSPCARATPRSTLSGRVTTNCGTRSVSCV